MASSMNDLPTHTGVQGTTDRTQLGTAHSRDKTPGKLLAPTWKGLGNRCCSEQHSHWHMKIGGCTSYKLGEMDPRCCKWQCMSTSAFPI